MTHALHRLPPYQQAIAKAHLCSCGTLYRSLDRPIIAIANSWNEITPGHAHLRELAGEVKRGVWDHGGLPLEFNTIAMCDGIAQGHRGMKYALPSREVIADSIEIMVQGHGIFDGLVLLGSCDKIVPAMLMAAARLNLPAATVTGGPMQNRIAPRQSKTARQQFLRGEITEAELIHTTAQYYPSPGVCPFLGTANTMGLLTEALGLSLPGSAVLPALSAARRQAAYDTGAAVMTLVKRDIRPRSILTAAAFANAITVVAATGGSLNTVLHLPAIAHECGLTITWDDFDRISRHTPLLTRLYPNSDLYTVADLYPVGGLPALLRELAPLLDTGVLTVTGHTLRENLANAPAADGTIIRPLTDPFAATGGMATLHGNLAPGGAVVKTSAVPPEQLVFTGPALVFESEEDCLAAAIQNAITPGVVVIIRNEGPAGGPGMREMHRATEILSRIKPVAIVTDGRFSGASGGLAVGYVSPEAASGGPIGLVATGDNITIDIPRRVIHWQIDETVRAERELRRTRHRNKQEDSNLLRLYGATTTAPADGAVRRML